MSQYVVQAPGQYWLVNTAFGGSIERAKKFDTVEAAQTAIDKAAKFSKPRIVKTWKIVPFAMQGEGV